MSISSELILSRVAQQAQVAAIECLCKAVQALAFTSLPNEQNPYYVPPATSGTNPTPLPETEPEGWTLCGAAYGYLEYLARYCDKLAELSASPIWSGLALLAAIVGGVGVALTPGVNITLALGGAGVATALWGWLATFGEDGLVALFETTAAELRDNDRLRTCITGKFVDDGTAVSMQAIVDIEVTDTVKASLIKVLITQETITAHRDGIVQDGQLYYPEADSSQGCGCLSACYSPLQVSALVTADLVLDPVRFITNSFSVNGDLVHANFTLKANSQYPYVGGHVALTFSNPQMQMWFFDEFVLTSSLAGDTVAIENTGVSMPNASAWALRSYADRDACIIDDGYTFGSSSLKAEDYNKLSFLFYYHDTTAKTYDLTFRVRGLYLPV